MRDPEADHDDHADYFHFTGPRRLEMAMHTLHGLVEGIRADSSVNDEEVKRLIQWMTAHQEFADIHPFDEVIKAIHRVTADGVIDADERDDLMWLARQFDAGNNLFDVVTADMQRLHGFLCGIVADRVISETELMALSVWLDEHTHLQSCWPYDELVAVVADVLRDGKIDDGEHARLLAFFSEFDCDGEHKAVSSLDPQLTIGGVCAMCPEITFLNHLFCFTGSSQRGPRTYLAGIVEQRGGIFKPNVTNETNYLIIGADGNPCWAYACYGRKVEQAVKRRRDGQRLQIIHEYDFWDAVAEAN
jgi:NAD-dependent DNA ligase